MRLSGCIFCKVAQDKSAPTFIAEMEPSVALLNFDQQNYPGRSLVVLKEHYEDYLKIPHGLREAFNEDMAHVSSAVQQAFGADRINYANLGNEVSHQHWHVIPRYKGDTNEGRPPWPVSAWEKLTADEYRAIAGKIRNALDLNS